MDTKDRAIRRVRHEVRQRRLTVRNISVVTPQMLRVTLSGSELAGFTSLGFDDHIKLFFPTPGVIEERPPMRDYTPRYDAHAGVLNIEFALHDAGPATAWATNAKVGDSLSIGGPRGSAIIPTDFDWHLLIGDETALPAIGRRLGELPAGTRALVIAEVEDSDEEQQFVTRTNVSVQWVHRRGAARGVADGLVAAVLATSLPAGDGFCWAAAESSVARALRTALVDGLGLSKAWVKAAGYWKRGAAAIHEPIDE
jgi:NADPH-dependent ferric siderophore reductase